MIRTDWNIEEIKEIYHQPLLKLISNSASIHRKHYKPGEIQASSLLSVKTGGCTEDCAYCPQSFKYKTTVLPDKLAKLEVVVKAAKEAKAKGCSRFCMGAAWREIRNHRDFTKITEMIHAVSSLDLEVCCSMGMLTYDQAVGLKEAGLSIYNHNIDTSDEYYPEIITTRKFTDRLTTIANVQEAGLEICSGGIVGMGESELDRIKMIHILATLEQHPASVPINRLIPIKGTPMEDQETTSIWELLRVIACIRCVMPKSQIRLSAGRAQLSYEEQALCFITGANAVFLGDKLLTASNSEYNKDMEMFELLGVHLN
jgi:biotin synthase